MYTYLTYTGLHPRIITEGFDVARQKALEVLEKSKMPIEVKRECLLDVARTSLKTKVFLSEFIVIIYVQTTVIFQNLGLLLHFKTYKLYCKTHQPHICIQDTSIEQPFSCMYPVTS